MIKSDFWSGKKVFITGHTGFKGSWLSLWLQQMGAIVTGFALPPPTNPNLFTLAKIANNMHSINGDVRNLNALMAAFKTAEPEIVFHLAAQALVRLSYENPLETYETNIMGTVNVLEAIRQTNSVKAAVIITTDKCYENKEWCWGYRENEAMGGHDPYSSSKGAAELIISAYRQSFFNNASTPAIASARAGNVIGGGDWAADRLIPDIIRAIESNSMLEIRYPEATRSWQHVLETLSGYMRLAEKLFQEGHAFAEGWNFGPNSEDAKPVRWIVDEFVALWQEKLKIKYENNTGPHEAQYLKLDISKAKSRLQWKPKLCLKDGLNMTIELYKEYFLKKPLREIMEKQIAFYTDI